MNRYSLPSQDPEDLVFNAASTHTAAVQFMQQAMDPTRRACSLGLGSAFERVFLPLMPGELVSIIGLSGNMKSSMMQYCLRTQAEELHRTGREGKEFVCFVSWEQSIEAMGLADISREIGVPVDQLARGDGIDQEWIDTNVLPLLGRLSSRAVLNIGSSGMRPNVKAPLTLDAVGKVLRWYCEVTGWHCHCLYLDYMQAIDTASGDNLERRLEVRENVFRAKNLAFELGCPVIAAVQAKQTVLANKHKLPGRYDGEETSGLAQRSDRILTVWYPLATEDEGSHVTIGPLKDEEVTPNLFILGIAKQKFGVSHGVFPLYVVAETNTFSELAWR